MDMDDARALVERAPRLARHRLGRDGRGIDRGVGQNAGQRAGDDGLVHSQPPSGAMAKRSARAAA